MQIQFDYLPRGHAIQRLGSWFHNNNRHSFKPISRRITPLEKFLAGRRRIWHRRWCKWRCLGCKRYANTLCRVEGRLATVEKRMKVQNSRLYETMTWKPNLRNYNFFNRKGTTSFPALDRSYALNKLDYVTMMTHQYPVPQKLRFVEKRNQMPICQLFRSL